MSKLDASRIVAVAAKQAGSMLHVTKPYKGGDPEFFLRTPDGRPISATDVFKTPDNVPCTYSRSDDLLRAIDHNAKLHPDGYQAEINFAPHTCREIIVMSIRSALSHVYDNMKLVPDISVTRSIDPEWLKTAPDSVLISGCNPDFDAYNYGEPNPPVDGWAKLPVRMCGGHIMTSIQSGAMYGRITNQDDVIRYIKLMDRIVGITSTLMSSGSDEAMRRKYYGRAGCYRWKRDTYLEYRTLSNFWLKSPCYAWVVYGLSELATTAFVSGLADMFLEGISDDDTRDIINNADRDKAMHVFKDMLPSLVALSNADWRAPFNRTQRGDSPCLSYGLSMATLLDHKPLDIPQEWGFNIPKPKRIFGVHSYRRINAEFRKLASANRAKYMRMVKG